MRWLRLATGSRPGTMGCWRTWSAAGRRPLFSASSPQCFKGTPPADDSNVLLEVQSGVGGTEACLFAMDLFKMYRTFCEQQGLEFEVLEESLLEEAGLDGLRVALVNVRGPQAYGWLQLESGVHRVQRVPVTGKQGKLHTSAAVVSAIAEPPSVELSLPPSELKISTMRPATAGGQHANRSMSAVRVTHLPTGIKAMNCTSRSQKLNIASAIKAVTARVYQARLQQIGSERITQVLEHKGTKDRSDKIRTYNWPQNRITDHRYNVKAQLAKVISGEKLGEFLEQVRKKAAEANATTTTTTKDSPADATS